MFIQKFLLILLITTLIFSILADENIIYSEQRSFSPVTYYFNAAFDVIQNPYYFDQTDYRQKHRTLFRKIFSLNHSVKHDGGWNKLFTDEFASKRVLPNIGLHLIGSGYDTREMSEYYTEKGHPFPLTMTILTAYAGHIGNEALESSNSHVTSHDHIADLFFYDVFAIVLFRNNSVSRFFHEDLGMRRWSYQPFIDFNNFELNNAGLNYIFRPDIFHSSIRPFVFIGMQNLAGLSYEYRSNKFLTLSSGLALTDPMKTKGYWASAIFLDDDDLLSASLIVNGTEKYRIRLNLYPNLFETDYKLGLMTGYKRNDDIMIGINYLLPLGMGIRI